MTVSLLYPIAPALLLVTLFFLGMAAFAVRVRMRGLPPLPDADRRENTAIATPFVIRYVLWFLTPIEIFLAALRISPTSITIVGLLVCGASGVAAARGNLAVAGWLYMASGMLDVLDGRVARRTGKASAAGALLDSVADRWGEFLLLGGMAFYLQDTLGLIAVLIAIAGSQMVSYTRARGEALGLTLAGGTMQRAERIVIVGLSLLAGAIGKVTHAFDGHFVVSVVLLCVGVFSAITSLHRLREGMNALRVRDAEVPSIATLREQREQRRARAAAESGPLERLR